MCLPDKCQKVFSFDSHIANSQKISLNIGLSQTENGYLNRQIFNPDPALFKNFIRFYDLRIDDTLKGRGIFTGILNKVEHFCDQNLVTIIISEFANQKLAYHLGSIHYL